MNMLVRLTILSTAFFLSFCQLTYADGVGYSAPGAISAPFTGVRRVSTSSPTQKVSIFLNDGEQLDIKIRRIQTVSPATAQPLNIRVYNPNGLEDTYSVATGIALGAEDNKAYTIASGEAGIWTVELDGQNNAIFWGYNINALQSPATPVRIAGRVFTEQLFISQNASTINQFSLHHVNEHGHIYQSSFFSYYGIDSYIQTDAFGNTTSSGCTPLYKSMPLSGSTVGNCGHIYKQFFVQPDNTLPATARRYDLVLGTTTTDWLMPVLATPDVTISPITFARTGINSSEAKKGNFNFIITGYTEIAHLLIDVNNDGDYTDAADRDIPFLASLNNTVNFDGLDGLGNSIPCNTAITAKVAINKSGEIHFLFNDIEGLQGVTITRLNGDGAPNSVIYWNDTELGPAGTSTSQPDGRAGVNSNVAGGVHGWSFPGGSSWGDNRNIENWSVMPMPEVARQVTIGVDCAVLPVSFGKVNAIYKGNGQLRVNWETLTELNNNFFIVEASADGKNFTKIGQITSKALHGNSDVVLDYEFTGSITEFSFAIGFVSLLLGFLGFVRSTTKSRVRMQIIGFAIMCLTIWACNKGGALSSDGYKDLFIRIAQIDVDGEKSYSKVVKVVK